MYSNNLDHEYKTGGFLAIYRYKYKIEYNGYYNIKTLEQFGKQYCSGNLIYEGFFYNNYYNGKGTLYKDKKKYMKDILKMENVMDLV